MNIGLRLQTDLILFKKHVISGVENQQTPVVGKSKVKDRDILYVFLTLSNSFGVSQTNSLAFF